MGAPFVGSEQKIEQLRALVDLLRANEHRATSIEVRERIRGAIEMFDECDTGRSAHPD